MAVNEDTQLSELNIYRAGRIGTSSGKQQAYKRTLGHKKYELSNHLGNVLAVITDNRLARDGATTDQYAEYFEAVVVMQTETTPSGRRSRSAASTRAPTATASTARR